MGEIIELDDYTVESIEKAKEILSADKRFRWIRKVSNDVFLDILFGWAEMSQVMRETLARLFEPKIQSEILERLVEKEPELPKAKNPIGYYTEIQGKILKVFLKYDIPLSCHQVAMITGIEHGKVRGTIESHLKKKGLIKKVEGTTLWELDRERLKKFAPYPPTTRQLIIDLLKKEKKPMSITEIAKAIKRKRSTVDAELYKMRKKGIAKLVKPGVFVLIER